MAWDGLTAVSKVLSSHTGCHPPQVTTGVHLARHELISSHQ